MNLKKFCKLDTVIAWSRAVGILWALGTLAVTAADPLKVVTFTDGVKLKVIGVSIGERRVNEPAEETAQLPPGLHEASGYEGGPLEVEVKQEREVVHCSATSVPRGALLMEISLAPRPGNPGPLTFHLEDGRVSQIPYNWEVGASEDFRPKSDRIEDLRAAMTATGLQLLIQHRDPDAGWIHLEGPFPFNLVSKDTSICLLSAWRRDLPVLDFRAIRDDGEVIEFSQPNPDVCKSPLSIIAAPLPQVHEGGDYSLRVLRVRKLDRPGYHPFCAVDIELFFGGREVSYTDEEPVVLGIRGIHRDLVAEDEWGNWVSLRGDVNRKSEVPGFYLPTHSKRVTLHLPVTRTDSHPRDVSDGFVILKGKVTDDGLHVDFELAPDAKGFGIQKMEAGQISALKPDEARGARAAWKALDCEITGEGVTHDLLPMLAKVGDKMEDWRCFVFPEGRDQSAGNPEMPSFRGTGTRRARYSFSQTLRWLAPPEFLKPGAKFRIGLGSPLKGDEVSFHLEIPAVERPE